MSIYSLQTHGPLSVLGMLVQILWYHSPHLMHLAMFTDGPSGIWQIQKMGVQIETLAMPLGLSEMA